MSTDLIDLVKEAIVPEAVQQLSSTLGESASRTQKALVGGAAAVLAGMAGRTSTARGLVGLVSLFDSPRAGSTPNFGHEVVQKVLGDNASPVADAISSQSGVQITSASSLLVAAAPLAILAISKASGPEGVTVPSLLSLLSSQRESFARYLPAGLGGFLGGAPRVPARSGATIAKHRYGPILAIIGALSIGLTVGGLLTSLKHETASAQAIGDSDTDAGVAAGIGSPVAVESSSLGMFFSKKLPDGTQINIPELGMENQLVGFIEGSRPADKETWFDFDRLSFDAGSATLQPSSQEQLDNIANILKAYPKVRVGIGGYTDNAGDPAASLMLSRERATNVMMSLVKAGVAPSGMTVEGYGEIHSVAGNGSGEGRSGSRSISLRVTSK